MPDDDEVQFSSSTTGIVQAVPPEHWDEALTQGYKPTTHKVIYSPEGQRGMVPNEQLQEKMKAGYQTTPETQFEKERKPAPEDTGVWGRTKQYGRDLGQMALGTASMASGAVTGRTPEIDGSLGLEDLRREQEGRSKPYRAIAGLGTLAGIDPTGMEESARRGDPTGVLTHAAAQATPLALAEGTKLGGKTLGLGAEARSLAKSTREIKEAAPPGRHEINY